MFNFSSLLASLQPIYWLILLVIAALLVGGFIFGRYDTQAAGRMAKLTELPQTALLIGLALIAWYSASATTSPAITLAAFILGGIVAGFVGDLFMANVFHQKDHVLFGMAAFGVGHILYMLGIREIALLMGLHNISSYVLALITMWVIALVLWAVLVRQPGGSRLQYAALGYGIFLASMAGFALGLALQQPLYIPLAVGAILFVVSDTLIASKLFAQRTFPYMGDVIWLTYIVAQVLIVTVVPITMAKAA